MDNFNYQKWVNENKESSLDEMAKITGELETAINNVINNNPNIEGVALKRLIKQDQDVINALEDGKLHDNQLNMFIAKTRKNPAPVRQPRNVVQNNPFPQDNTTLNNLDENQLRLLKSKGFRNSNVLNWINEKCSVDEFKNYLFNIFINSVNNLGDLKPSNNTIEIELFQKTFSQGSNAGNMGEGELYSILKLNNAKAGTRGDMEYDGEQIEIKKSNAVEFSGTYTTAGILDVFETINNLTTIGNLMKRSLGGKDNVKALYKNGSEEFKKLIKILAKYIDDSKINIGGDINFDIGKYSLPNLKNITNENEKQVIKKLHNIIGEWRDEISTEQFTDEFKNYLLKFFDKADKVLLYARAKTPSNAQIMIIDRENIDDILDVDKSTIRGGFTGYVKLNQDGNNQNRKTGNETYSPYQKLVRGYGINITLIGFFKRLLNKMYEITDI